VIKVWLAADLLMHVRQGFRPPLSNAERARVARMIRLSDDEAAQQIYLELGGDASVRRMIGTCRLTDARLHPAWWSLTQVSARDLISLGVCVGPGGVLDPVDSGQLLELMRSVAPSNAFGIAEALPAGERGTAAVKNGWTAHSATGLWNVNCLAVWGPASRWVLAVTSAYPMGLGQGYGAETCRRVTAALFPP
jgi:hypothetical protein